MRAALFLVVLAVPVLAAPTAPRLKAGLWEQVQTMSGIPGMPAEASKPMTSRFCTDDATQAKMNMLAAAPRNGGQCATPRISSQGDATVMDVDCTAPGGGTSQMHVVARGDFNSRYISDMTMKIGGHPAGMPPGMALPTIASHSTTTYAGACPTGMRPGDVNYAGRTMNVLDGMAKSRP